eukprot:2051773-Pyramimonas_sp.AAC.1
MATLMSPTDRSSEQSSWTETPCSSAWDWIWCVRNWMGSGNLEASGRGSQMSHQNLVSPSTVS